MSESTHTPGPWGMKYDEFDDAWHVTPDGLGTPAFGEWSPLCVLGSYDENEEANARLIAAAPDMLEALKVAKELADVMEGLCSGRSDDEWVWAAQEKINAAISKAQGGAA